MPRSGKHPGGRQFCPLNSAGNLLAGVRTHGNHAYVLIGMAPKHRNFSCTLRITGPRPHGSNSDIRSSPVVFRYAAGAKAAGCFVKVVGFVSMPPARASLKILCSMPGDMRSFASCRKSFTVRGFAACETGKKRGAGRESPMFAQRTPPPLLSLEVSVIHSVCVRCLDLIHSRLQRAFTALRADTPVAATACHQLRTRHPSPHSEVLGR